jgi:hypothetical protein
MKRGMFADDDRRNGLDLGPEPFASPPKREETGLAKEAMTRGRWLVHRSMDVPLRALKEGSNIKYRYEKRTGGSASRPRWNPS